MGELTLGGRGAMLERAVVERHAGDGVRGLPHGSTLALIEIPIFGALMAGLAAGVAGAGNEAAARESRRHSESGAMSSISSTGVKATTLADLVYTSPWTSAEGMSWG